MSDPNIIELARTTLRAPTTEYSKGALLEMIRHLVCKLDDTQDALSRAEKDLGVTPEPTRLAT